MKNLKRMWVVLALLLALLLTWQPQAVLADTQQSANAAEAGTVKFRVNNKSEGPLRITLQGPKNYYLTAPLGTSKHDVIPGTYTYGYLAYGMYNEGTLEIIKDGVQLTIASQNIKVQIKNSTGVALTLRLAGPQTKNISVPPGNTKVDVWKGSYEYSYTAYGLYKEGKIEFLKPNTLLELPKLTAKLNIDNKSGAQVVLNLAGTRYYNLTVNTGKFKTEVLKGKYTYSYLDHGVYESGEISIQDEQATLTLPNNIASLKVSNKSGADLQISLQGKSPYFLNARAGNSQHVIRRGTYEYSYYACGAWQSGEIKVDNNTYEFKIASCNTATAGGVKLIIINNTNGILTLHLVGPAEYWFHIAPGKETVTVVKGTYDYTVWGCGGSTGTGTKKLTSKSEWRFWCQ